MKKLIITILALVLAAVPAASIFAANGITERLAGRLLLKVEGTGQIWWVNPEDMQKYEVTFANAMDLFRNHALGVSNNDLSKIKININSVGSSPDADRDGFRDRDEILAGFNPFGPGKQIIDKNLSKRLAGRMLLQVEDMGRVWYVDPVSLTMYEVKFATLMDLFRGLALGITDADLETVGPNWLTYINSQYGYEIKYPSYWVKNEFADGNTESALFYKDARILLSSGGHGAPFGWTKKNLTIVIDSRQCPLIEYWNKNRVVEKDVILPNGKGGNFQIDLVGALSDDIIKDFDQIISTFEFIDEVVNWQTYTNSKYGYEVKYPNSWEINNNRSTKNEVVFYFGLAESREAIKVEDDLGKSLDEWRSVYEGEYYIISSKKLNIDGADAYQLDSSEFGLKYIIVLNDGYLYTFTTGGYMIDNDMLSTFKFIDEMKDWQTYRNEVYGYEFKYPLEWEDKMIYELVDNDMTLFYLPAYKNPDDKSLGTMNSRFFCVGRLDIGEWEFEYQKFIDGERPSLGDEITRDDVFVYYRCPQYEAFEFIVSPAPLQRVSEIMSTFRLIKDNQGLLQFCPDEWIDNQMPTIVEPGEETPERQYYVVDGKRRELSEFDVDWVRETCNLQPQVVY